MSTIAAPPTGTTVVCTLFWFTRVPPSPYTSSKISPTTWNEDSRRGTGVAQIEPHAFTRPDAQCVVAHQRADAPVEHHVFGLLAQRLGQVEVLRALLAVGAAGVELALHDEEFLVDLGHALLGLDQDQSVHAVGQVHAGRRRDAVIQVEAGAYGAPGERGAVTGRHERSLATAAGPGRGVKIDVVRDRVVGMILEARFDQVAFAHANELPGRVIAKRPVGIADAVGDLPGVLLHLDFEQHLGGVASCYRQRHVRRGSSAARSPLRESVRSVFPKTPCRRPQCSSNPLQQAESDIS